MKQKKKMLLAMAALSAVAVGVGTTSTFAWYQATATASVSTDNSTVGALTVAKTESSLSYNAQIHLTYGNPSNSSIKLTDWGTGDDAAKLYTGTVPSNVTDNSNPTLTEVTISAQTMIIEVKAYVTDESTNKSETGHFAAWESEVTALNASKTVTFSYVNTVDTGNLLLTSEVFFYTAEDTTTSAASAYAKAEEAISGGNKTGTSTKAKQTIAINVNDLKADSHFVTSAANAVRVGWLYVRFSGAQRQHDNDVTYQATIAANFPS